MLIGGIISKSITLVNVTLNYNCKLKRHIEK